MARGENKTVIRPGDPVDGPPRLDDRYFVPRDVIAKAFAGLEPIDCGRLRADIDAHVDQDSTPRFWRED
jgi:hypothetical protein